MRNSLFALLDLRKEVEDFDTIHAEIEKGIVFKGTNLWVLVFSIVIASIGLNTNSTAVIIGAMLISPLMGPINGLGYSIATYNFYLFRKSLKNFGLAVLVSIIASTVYFALSPVSTAHSELLARTNPTIYDVLIALFGGLAGIVAISSKLKGNVIPGVAIATALMPPLCTAGYGLATGQFNFFFGAFYLFTINSVFIGISAMLVSQFLNFPIRTLIDPKRKKQINHYITFIILVTFIPSIYFGYLLVEKEKFNKNAIEFCKNVSFIGGAYLLKNEIDENKKTIRLIYGGNALGESEKNEIFDKASNFNVENAKITINQGFAFNESSANEIEVLRNRLNALNLNLNEKEQKIDSLINYPKIGRQILNEIKPLYPQINSCSFSETMIFSDTSDTFQKRTMVILTSSNFALSQNDKKSITEWLKARQKTNKLIVYFDNN